MRKPTTRLESYTSKRNEQEGNKETKDRNIKKYKKEG